MLPRPAPVVFALLLTGLAYALLQEAGPQARLVGCATTLLICSWALRLVGEGTAAMAYFLVLALSHAVEPDVIFSGFTTPAFWLVFSGLVIGKAVQESGLSSRFAAMLGASRSRSYPLLLARLIAICLALAFFLPSSMARIVILLPILMDLARNLGFSEGSKGYSGIVLAGVLGTYMGPYAILPANLSNIILAGASKTLYDIDLGYVQYLVLHFPVLGALKSLFLWVCLCLLFPATLDTLEGPRALSAWTRREKWTMFLLAMALLGWMTDSLHGVSPGWVSLAVAVLFLAPVLGWPSEQLLSDIKMDTLLFVACAIGVGNIIKVSNLGSFIASHLLQVLPLDPGGGLHNVGTVLGLFLSTGLLTSLPGIPSVFVPLAQDMAVSAHIPLFSLLMLLALAYSTVLLPYQGPPLIVATHVARLPYRSMLVTCLLMALASMLLLFPLDLLWWKALGVPLSG